MLGMLRNIFKFAIGKHLLDRDPSIGIEAKDPAPGARTSGPNSKSKSPVYMLDLTTSKRLACRLHIHHQMAFWLLRCVGLRISEAYGITLEDIYRSDGHMTIRIWRQGGKNFLVRDAEGKKKITKIKTTVKTTSSARLLPIAKPVAELIDHYIEAFHEGEDDSSTPGMASPKSGSRSRRTRIGNTSPPTWRAFQVATGRSTWATSFKTLTVEQR